MNRYINIFYTTVWGVILPEFLKNGIVFCYIYFRYGATKSLRGLCDTDFYGLLSGSIVLAPQVILGPNLVLSGSGIRVGRYTYIGGQGEILSSEQNPIHIGSFCSIARNFYAISYSLHDGGRLSTSTSIHGPVVHPDKGGPISIGHDVWIGANVTILPGVTIGNGAIIGAGSIVTKSIPPYAVAVGNPARVIRYRFDQEVIEQLEEERWWEKGIEEIYQIHGDFDKRKFSA